MYTPGSFHETDESFVLDFIDGHGFATLISGFAGGAGGEPIVTHVPLILERSASGPAHLLGHVARANPHWKRFDGREPALAVFLGPHAYVSPSWYVHEPWIPTWNYAVVHAHGTCEVMDPTATWASIRKLIEKYESRKKESWIPELPPDLVESEMQSVVGFRMSVTRLDAKFKLGQNRHPDDRAGALAGLEREEDFESRGLAAFARRYFERKRDDR